jgi:hypothetical protein
MSSGVHTEKPLSFTAQEMAEGSFGIFREEIYFNQG